MRISTTGLLLSLALLTACGPGSGTTETAASEDAGVAASSTAETALEGEQPMPAKPEGPIWFEPAALEECGKPEVLTVHWETASLPDAKTVNIMAVKPDGTESLFLTAGRQGSRETGRWMRAGSQMVLRNKADDVELGRATVDSIPCD